MFSRRIAIGSVAAAAVASAVLGSTAATAGAATLTANITAGSAASGTPITITGATSASPGVTFKDLRSGASLTCTSATATASAKTGAGQALAGIAKITASTWTTCKGPLGLSFTVSQVGTWTLNATGATASNKTAGTITTVSANVNGGSTCTFPVTGSAAASFTNTTTTAPSVLSVASAATAATATLKIGTVTGGCAGGIIKTGDTASFTANYNVTGKVTSSGAAANPVKVVVS